jgi:hypothetical protein
MSSTSDVRIASPRCAADATAMASVTVLPRTAPIALPASCASSRVRGSTVTARRIAVRSADSTRHRSATTTAGTVISSCSTRASSQNTAMRWCRPSRAMRAPVSSVYPPITPASGDVPPAAPCGYRQRRPMLNGFVIVNIRSTTRPSCISSDHRTEHCASMAAATIKPSYTDRL